MASPTQWTWVWANSGNGWWTGKPGVLQSMGLQEVRHDWATELTELMTYDMEQFFICLIGISMSSPIRCPFRSHAHFWIRLFIFLLLNCKSSLYILDISPLLDVSFENIFSQVVAYVLILLRIFTFYFTHFSIVWVFFSKGNFFFYKSFFLNIAFQCITNKVWFISNITAFRRIPRQNKDFP